MIFKLNSSSIIYIVCPANYATGGTELLHQLAYKLEIIGFKNVKIFYVDKDEKKVNPIHENFIKYNIKYSDLIIDSTENVIIVPETYTHVLNNYKKIQKSIWWLSVDNYFVRKRLNYNILYYLKTLLVKGQIILPKKYFSFNKKKNSEIIHLYQSEYANNFLEKRGIISNKAFLSDYLNSTFLKNDLELFGDNNRTNNIIYNPYKGFKFTKKLIDGFPNYNWIPIKNMSPKQVHDLMLNSKVYIDFGNHPGKDRLPREAAISGCCIITGKKGSASNNIDVPIPNEYKFDEEISSFSGIINKIDFCFNNYYLAIEEFKEYRKKILFEEKLFEDSIKKIFIDI